MSPPSPRPLSLIADMRERASGIPQALSRKGVEVRLKTLAAGDYILAPHVAIERKTTADFIQSIFDRRLFMQTHALSAAFAHPLLLLEETETPVREIHPHAWRGALLYVSVLNHIPIVHAKNSDDTVELIFTMLQLLHQEPQRNFSLYAPKRPTSPELSQRYILETLPGIGPHLADALLKQLGSLHAVFNAQPEELQQIAGIGSTRAQKIHEILHREYKN